MGDKAVGVFHFNLPNSTMAKELQLPTSQAPFLPPTFLCGPLTSNVIASTSL